jgi:hypothetical protein
MAVRLRHDHQLEAARLVEVTADSKAGPGSDAGYRAQRGRTPMRSSVGRQRHLAGPCPAALRLGGDESVLATGVVVVIGADRDTAVQAIELTGATGFATNAFEGNRSSWGWAQVPFDSDTTMGSKAFALDSYKPPPAHDPGPGQATASSVACGLGSAFDGARISVERQADPARAEAAPAEGGTTT